MITPSEYQSKNAIMMREYEERVRAWLAGKGAKELSMKIPFFKDGVTCPEIWFRENNAFRPLFILKEVSLGTDDVEAFLQEWGYQKRFDFVENPFQDVKVGVFRTWRRIACLAKALEDIHGRVHASAAPIALTVLDKPNISHTDRIDISQFAFMSGGEEYYGRIEENHRRRTANPTYNEIIDKIAAIEIKKIGAGKSVGSKLFIATRYYSCHIEPFFDLLCRQIELINPTLIICLGREGGACISRLLSSVRNNTQERLWIDGYHPAFSSNVRFYDEPLDAYVKYCKAGAGFK